jgi:ATP-dependent protease ClpP protease subunit
MANQMFSTINKPLKLDSDFQGYFLLSGSICDETVLPVMDWILQANIACEAQPDLLNLLITSGGGEMASGLALIDMIRGSSIPIRTIGMGEIASAALMILMSGAPGLRIITPNTLVMSHQFSWQSTGKQHELEASSKAFNITTKMMMNHYKKCTGLDENTIRKILLPPSDVYMDAKTALKYKLCDKVSGLE